jgi:hypothetical protein
MTPVCDDPLSPPFTFDLPRHAHFLVRPQLLTRVFSLPAVRDISPIHPSSSHLQFQARVASKRVNSLKVPRKCAVVWSDHADEERRRSAHHQPAPGRR